jgi:hypothetical protein
MLRVLRKPIPLRKSSRKESECRCNNSDESQASDERNFSNMLHYIDRSPLGHSLTASRDA